MRSLLKFVFLTFFILNAHAELNFTLEEKNYINTREVKVAMLPDFPPFSIYENEKLEGYSHDILELITQKSGLNIKYEIDNWPVNLKKFKEKEVDIIDAISFRESRLAFTNYTKPYYEVPLVIFSRKDLNSYVGLDSLKGKKLGITKNIFYKQQIKDLGIFELVEYDSFQDKLKALAFGKVDVIFGHLLSTQIAIKNSKYTNMKVLDKLNLPNLKKTDLRFGIVKDDKVLYSIINKVFSSLTNKEWDLLHSKWISIYTPNDSSYKSSIVNLTGSERSFLIKNNLRCVTTNSWAPFNFKESGKLNGISYDFWNLIKEKTLISSNCKSVDTFHEVLELIKNKEVDLTLSTAITDDKLLYGRFSIPYVSYPIAIATTLDKRYISDTKSLNNKKVAVGRSYSAYQILKDKYPDIDFVEVDDNFEALRLLSKGDVYAVVDILPVLSHLIGNYGFKNLKISGTTEFDFDVRIMVRNDYEELIPIINKGINAISKNESQDIKNRWLSVKFENLVNYSKLWEIGVIILIILLILFYRQYILNKHNKKLQEANHEIEIKTIELQRKSRQLAKQKELFEKIYYESSDGIFLMSINDKKIIDCNDVAFKLLSYDKKEEFINLKEDDLFPLYQLDGLNSIENIHKMINIAIEKGSNTFEFLHRTKDDKKIWLEVVLTPINIDEESLLHVVWRNIDKRKHMENELSILTHNLEDKVKKEVKKNEEKTKQLLQQSRLAQMGEMISMIAHQWRQPLTAISATTNNLLIRMIIDDKIEKKDLQKEINLISDYSQHLSMTIDDFRNFFKTDKDKTDATLESIIENSISIVRNSLQSNNIILTTDFQCNENLNIFATEVNQVILNLIKNAEDALVDNLILEPKIVIKTYCEEKYSIVEISDNANGIPEDILEKIFDPYFSTKKNKDGTGLGLYMSKIIINDHCNGVLSVENSSDGATFKVKIPFE
ncbi:transporter substrate-binding domain-containing protein [Arcobacter sp. LA11]|uniref:transporter substrate-binding domain-containing protein n=1 Tax=Arcobacter sp. LA11 TaxID=1898176 RepID=UPI0009F8FD25|nr:transporter substrate-binding domain-containing protein [Arcobacter sp. LA11]